MFVLWSLALFSFAWQILYAYIYLDKIFANVWLIDVDVDVDVDDDDVVDDVLLKTTH